MGFCILHRDPQVELARLQDEPLRPDIEMPDRIMFLGIKHFSSVNSQVRAKVHVIAIGTQRFGIELDNVVVSCNRQTRTRVKPLSYHRLAVDLGTVAAIQIADEPIAVLQRQATMLRRDVVEPQSDIGLPFAAHQQTEHYQKWKQTVADWMAQPRQGVKHQSLFFGDDSG